MTALGRREPRFSDITRVTTLGTRFYAMTGLRQTVLVASNVSGLATIAGETADLGAPARDIASNGSNKLCILTDEGAKITSLADTPVVSATSAFDPGDGRWAFYRDGYFILPVEGGVRVLDQTALTVKESWPLSGDGCVGAALSADDILYVVDDKKARIHVFRILGDTPVFVDTFRAANCRDVVKVVLDEDAEILYVMCKRRIVSFSVPNSGAEDSDIVVDKIQDVGPSDGDYTDMVDIGLGLWIGIDADTAFKATPSFMGRQFASWDDANDMLLVACPDFSHFAASDVVPYVEDIADIPDAEPLVAAPAAPVITSSLAIVGEPGDPVSYTITATGSGPITFGLLSPPSGFSVNALTGVVSGTVPGSGPVNISITATNAGGTDTETLVLTVGDAPEITSASSIGGTEDAVFSFFVTATGLAPITYSATGLPSGLSINSATGEITGTPTASGITVATITATNALGFDSEPLTFTIESAIADLGDIAFNGDVYHSCCIGTKIYVTGNFTTVTDAGGTYARASGTACLDTSTGLFTAWAPAVSGGSKITWFILADSDGDFIYIFGSRTDYARRYDPDTGALDSGWLPTFDGPLDGLRVVGTRVHVAGQFSTINATGQVGYGAVLRTDASLDAWRPLNNSGNPPTGTQSTGSITFDGTHLWVGLNTQSGSSRTSRGFAKTSPSSGVPVALVHGISETSSQRVYSIAVNNGFVMTVGSFQFSPSQVLRNSDDDFVTNIDYICLFQDDGTYVSSTALQGEGIMWEAAAHPSGDFFAAGEFLDIGGDTSYRGVARLDNTGALVPGFHPTWTGNPSVYGVSVMDSGAVVIVGNLGSTINGEPRVGLALLNADTGAPY